MITGSPQAAFWVDWMCQQTLSWESVVFDTQPRRRTTAGRAVGLAGGASLDGSAGRNMTENCRGGGDECVFLINNLKNKIILCYF